MLPWKLIYKKKTQKKETMETRGKIPVALGLHELLLLQEQWGRRGEQKQREQSARHEKSTPARIIS